MGAAQSALSSHQIDNTQAPVVYANASGEVFANSRDAANYLEDEPKHVLWDIKALT